jgi:hypothetical protein
MTTPLVKCRKCGYEGAYEVEIWGGLCQDCGELRNLDDLWKDAVYSNNGCDDEWAGDCVARHLLKQEAIRWLKYVLEHNNTNEHEASLRTTKNWIRYFFGIKEEDLVEGKNG